MLQPTIRFVCGYGSTCILHEYLPFSRHITYEMSAIEHLTHCCIVLSQNKRYYLSRDKRIINVKLAVVLQVSLQWIFWEEDWFVWLAREDG